jgi:hypothetical protein
MRNSSKFHLSENEKRDILNLHKKFITENQKISENDDEVSLEFFKQHGIDKIDVTETELQEYNQNNYEG